MLYPWKGEVTCCSLKAIREPQRKISEINSEDGFIIIIQSPSSFRAELKIAFPLCRTSFSKITKLRSFAAPSSAVNIYACGLSSWPLCLPHLVRVVPLVQLVLV